MFCVEIHKKSPQMVYSVSDTQKSRASNGLFCVKHLVTSPQMVVCLVSNTTESTPTWFVLCQTPYKVASDGMFCAEHNMKSPEMERFVSNSI